MTNLMLAFDALPDLESTANQPGHLKRLAIENRKIIKDRQLWETYYHALQPALIKYYDSVNAGDFLASSESSGYRKWADENNIARSLQLAFELFAVDKAPAGPVLVLGTGSGFDTAIPAASFQQRKFIATDASPIACQNASQLLETLKLGNAEVRNIDYQSYLEELPHDSLAAVISNWTMSGSLNPLETLAKIYAKLAPNGLLAITESPGSRLSKDAYDELGIARLLERRGDGIAPKIYFRQLATSLKSAGFRIIATSKGVADASDTVIAIKSDRAKTMQAHEVLAAANVRLERSRRMLADLFS